MAKRTSKAARDLSAELERLDRDISPRCLEDWSGEGLLRCLSQPGSGSPDESLSAAPETAVERALRAESLVARYRLFPRAVLAMFAEGTHEVSPDKWERAWRRLLDRAEGFFTKAPGDDGRRAAIAATHLARRAGKRADFAIVRERLQRVAGAKAIYASERMRRYFNELGLVMLTGQTPSEQGFDQLVFGFGIADALRETSASGLTLGGQFPHSALKTAISQVSISGLRSDVESARREQLIQARREATSLVAFSRAFSSVARRVHGVRHAFGFAALGQMDSYGTGLLALAVLVVRNALPGRLDPFVQMIDSHRPRFEAMNHLLDHVESRFHTMFQGEESVSELSKRELTAFRRQLDKYQTRYPRNFDLALADK